jgi:transcriptional regulator with XRE-family HTH domain
MLAPDVRSQFAERLKNIRSQRGFGRARYFARALGIEENRYTRYERAEVEPNLTLIHKMCEMLGVTPNELLGFNGPRQARPGFGEASPDRAVRGDSRDVAGDAFARAADRLESLAWRLATEAVAVRQQHSGKSRTSGDPLETFRETASLFRSLQSDPFGSVAEIVAEPALKSLDAGRKAELADLIRLYTDTISETAFVENER